MPAKILLTMYGRHKKLKRNLKTLSLNLKSTNKDGVKRLAKFIQYRAKANLQSVRGVTSPGLQNNIIVVPGNTEYSMKVTAMGRQARPIEFGFKEHYAPAVQDVTRWAKMKLGYTPSKYLRVGPYRGIFYMKHALDAGKDSSTLRRIFGDRYAMLVKKFYTG